MPFDLSPETIAIVTVGLALATLILTTTAGIRSEARAARAAWEAESRQLRDEARAHRDAVDAQARADREAWERRIAEADAEWKAQTRADREAWERRIAEADAAWKAESRADREHFQREILRLTGETARLGSRDLPEQSDA